jgi:hypothetical protein
MSLDLIIDSGSYSGTEASLPITIGWQPCLVIIASSRSSGPAAGRAIAFKSSDMSGSFGWLCDVDAEYTTDIITLTTTGFTVGSDVRVNNDGTTFYWVAVRAHPAIDCGQYVGDIEPTQEITLNRQPSALFQFTLADPLNPTVFNVWMKAGAMLGSFASRFRSQILWLEFIATFISTGFTAGSATNGSTATYAYVALYNLVGSTQHFDTGGYVGSAGSNVITLGYQPRFVFVWAGDNEKAGFKIDTMPSDEGGTLGTQYDWTAGLLTITSTGFTVPIASDVNEADIDYHWLAGRY